jgi:hypothetical protein
MASFIYDASLCFTRQEAMTILAQEPKGHKLFVTPAETSSAQGRNEQLSSPGGAPHHAAAYGTGGGMAWLSSREARIGQ